MGRFVKDDETAEIAWKLFRQTGSLSYYMLYKQLKKCGRARTGAPLPERRQRVEVKVDAIVLRTADYGESDKMLTLFTLQQGKLSAAAKGVRRAGAKLRFAAQPFCFAEYVLARRGERNTVISAANTDGFYALREDICKFYAAASLTGICDVLLYDGIVNEELFLRAAGALRAMCEGDEAEALISFFLAALELSGYMLDLSGCACCGASPPRHWPQQAIRATGRCTSPSKRSAAATAASRHTPQRS